MNKYAIVHQNYPVSYCYKNTEEEVRKIYSNAIEIKCVLTHKEIEYYRKSLLDASCCSGDGRYVIKHLKDKYGLMVVWKFMSDTGKYFEDTCGTILYNVDTGYTRVMDLVDFNHLFVEHKYKTSEYDAINIETVITIPHKRIILDSASTCIFFDPNGFFYHINKRNIPSKEDFETYKMDNGKYNPYHKNIAIRLPLFDVKFMYKALSQGYIGKTCQNKIGDYWHEIWKKQLGSNTSLYEVTRDIVDLTVSYFIKFMNQY